MMSFFGGCALIMTAIALFFLTTPPSNMNDAENRYIRHSTAIIRLVFMLVYAVFAAGFCVKVFVEYDINYIYIFDLDPQRKMLPH